MADYTVRIKIIADTQQAVAGFKNANKSLDTMNATVGRVLRTMTAFAALWAARKLIGGIGESIKGFAEFEKGVSNIGILLGEEINRLDEFKNSINGIASGLGIATEDILKSGFDIQSATNNVSKSLDIMTASSRLAVAGGSDMASTTSGLLTLMESYGDKLRGAADGADLLLKTQQYARATIGDLSQSISKFLPVASQMGIKQEELLGIFAQLTRSLGNTREASTALSMILQNLIKGTGQLQSWSQKMYGTNIQNAVATKGLAQIMKDLSKVESGYIGKLITRQRAIKGVTSTTGKWAEIQHFINGLLERQGFTQEKLDIQLQTAQVQIQQLTEKWQQFKRVVGEELVKAGAVKGTTKLLDSQIEAWKITIATAKHAVDMYKDLKKSGEEYMIMNRLATASSDEAAEIMRELADSLPKPEKINATTDSMDIFKGKLDEVIETRNRFLSERKEEIIPTPTEETLNVWQTYIEMVSQGFNTLAEKADAFSEKVGTKVSATTLKVATDIQQFFTQVGNSISSNFASTMADIVVDGKDAGEAFKEMWTNIAKSIVAGLAKMVAELLIWIATVQAARAMGVPIPPSFGGGGGGGILGSIGKIFGFQRGGIVPGVGSGDKIPALLEPGELVIPKEQVGNVTNNNPTVNISMAGAMIMDDPIAVEKLYREGLRDIIRDDIRTRRDTFYG